MTLTPQQLALLRSDLNTLVRLDYEHLRDELLDHYATLTEENMEAGLSFCEAHAAAWLAMGNGEGIQKVQTRYELVTRRQLKARHYTIMKHFFRWPALVTTLLVATLVTYLLMIVPANVARLLTGFLLISPVFVMIAVAIPYYQQKDSRKKLVWKYITQRANLPIAILNILNVFNPAVLREPSYLGTLLLVLMACGGLYLTVSLTQLMREHFSFKLT